MSEDHAEPKEKKRKAAGDNVTTLRTENMTSGEILRAAREKRQLALEDVSAAIHVRTAQLRAIEEGNIDALPGMTYAVGFVKSYASYLKLSPIDLGNKFKAEHGALKPLMPDLPEIKPVVESRMPDPRLVGVAAFFAVVLLLGWTFFADDSTPDDLSLPQAVATQDNAPAGEEVLAGDNVTDEVTAPADAAVSTAGSPEDSDAVSGEKSADSKLADKVDDKKIEEKAQAAEATITETQDAAVSEAAAVGAQDEGQDEAVADAEAIRKKAAAEAVASAALQAEAASVAANAAGDETITIRKTGRVALRAQQTSWVQVSDASERIVFKKLLRAGEQYTVPEGSGYTLITTNAGGLDVIVDGQKAPSLGKSGEILRGVELDPAALTRVKRARSRINN